MHVGRWRGAGRQAPSRARYDALSLHRGRHRAGNGIGPAELANPARPHGSRDPRRVLLVPTPAGVEPDGRFGCRYGRHVGRRHEGWRPIGLLLPGGHWAPAGSADTRRPLQGRSRGDIHEPSPRLRRGPRTLTGRLRCSSRRPLHRHERANPMGLIRGCTWVRAGSRGRDPRDGPLRGGRGASGVGRRGGRTPPAGAAHGVQRNHRS